MTYFEAKDLWEALNDVMTNDQRLRGFRPTIQRDGNAYKVEIREIYS